MSFYLNEYITLHFTVDVNIILKSCYNNLYGNVNIAFYILAIYLYILLYSIRKKINEIGNCTEMFLLD